MQATRRFQPEENWNVVRNLKKAMPVSALALA